MSGTDIVVLFMTMVGSLIVATIVVIVVMRPAGDGAGNDDLEEVPRHVRRRAVDFAPEDHRV